MPRHIDAPQDDGRQQRQRQQAAHQTQLLPDDGEDEVRVAVWQAGRRLALGLHALEQTLSEDLAAAQRQQTAGLLPAGVQRVIAVVKQDDEPIFHVGIQQVQIPHGVEQQRRRAAADQEPAQRHARHKAHAGEDEQEHQCAAHVAGYLVIQHEDHAEVYRQHRHRGHGFQIAVLLQPRQLLGQHQNEGDLHDLRRLHLHRKEGKIQPRAVARAAVDAQRRGQQQDEADAHQEYPLPVFHQLAHVDLRHQQIQQHANDQRRRLHQHKAVGVHIPGGAGHHQHAEQRCAAAQRQQQQIGLPQHIVEQLPYTAQHGGTSLSAKFLIQV